MATRALSRTCRVSQFRFLPSARPLVWSGLEDLHHALKAHGASVGRLKPGHESDSGPRSEPETMQKSKRQFWDEERETRPKVGHPNYSRWTGWPVAPRESFRGSRRSVGS